MKRLTRMMLFAAAWLAVATLAVGQAFPSKLVTITAPYSAGAAPAVFTHLMADKLAAAWGVPVIVDARPGGSGFIAIDAVKKAAPDGHELLVVSNAHVAINPALYKKLPYDPQKDFVPVAMFYRTPFFLIVSTSGPFTSVPALIAAAKAKPDTISYGSSYVGSPSHLGSAEFEFLTGTKMIHVPYKDQSQMYVGIANGDLGWAFSTLGSALPLMQAGKIKPLAIVAPRGTPPEVVRRINADVNTALANPEVQQQLQQFGFEAAPGTPEQFTEVIGADARKYSELVRRTGATAD